MSKSAVIVDRSRQGRQRKKRWLSMLRDNGWRVLLVVVIVAFWQFGVSIGLVNAFLMGSPAGIWLEFVRLVSNGELLQNTSVTVYATITGFVLGSLLGSFSGLLLWHTPILARILDPFFIALNSLPKIALAPIIIIWFGSGLFSKIALAFIATYVVALISAWQGTHQIDDSQVNLMRSLGANRNQIFRKVVVPSTLPWIISAFRLNIGFALIADIGGEFISSDYGLGKMIFVAGNLFNLNVVWVGVFTLLVVALVLYLIVVQLQRRLLPWEHKKTHR
ncbi:ABC transporter permease [Klebsiella michiganensis]|uniref:ABC transporter permease n=1 Tax=Klebsiella michiganensis TaxID=1134687 RepID=UPI0025931643|nr:ABC transporter permease [Klebsiella michiganensis]MDM4126552.1 ABC transporter permease [Klebsiella michiganensis]MDM4163373.1 ABC transporter permease [Klebsiella michiganensis]HCE9036910.1 ABC transporter permease [Klebsiella michiganensis]HCE9049083.1 ABC transporter permease [Klebsiella michiganensis]HDX9145888.1 ABC transporter permease [Klebsiella michiganensis]